MIGLLFVFVIGNSTLNTMFPDSPATAWINNFLLFSSGAEGLFYFLIGGWFASHEIGKRPRLAIYCAGAVSLVLAIMLNYEHSLQHGWDLYYVNRGNILIAIMSCALFLCFQYSRSADGKMGKLGKWVVSCGLMIYLIHPFVRLVLEGFPVFDPVIQLMYDHAAAGVLIVSSAVYLISLAISSVLKWGALIIRKRFQIKG